ncbi:hypothetical protein CDL15_Pgr027522 [Punica granatum]|uniref:peptidylprolyl isomerase n=1 Tax=Punica granatum TaxID=22663 RepID=A0A218XHQ2_PUNGR|nr:hypothetical protein CDL15_Pgr027522 [Punica granatum]
MAMIMEAAIKSPLLPLNPMVRDLKQAVDICIPNLSLQRACFPLRLRPRLTEQSLRAHRKFLPPICAATSDIEEAEVSSSHFEDFSVARTCITDDAELKINVEVSGAKTREVFDSVFDKMVAAAQPIPGFRREKGGKTPNIPRDILLEVLGPSKVYKLVIKSIINSTVAEYVQKNGLKVSKNLKVEQSYEDLEAEFEPDETFSFDATIQLIKSN